MKLKNKTTLLAAAIALAGVTYLPSASANVITLPTLDSQDSKGVDFKHTTVGVFTDEIYFDVNGPFSVDASAKGFRLTATQVGTVLTSFSLYDAITNLNIASSPIVTSFTAATSTAPAKTYFNSEINVVEPLSAFHSYRFEIIGNALNTKSTYHAGLDTLPAAVPLPAAAWMMLTGMIGLLGYQARNKKTA
ncbi:MAG: VPLPA-CTERM sorting domain-containing protein [Methylococcaceae bacterium]